MSKQLLQSSSPPYQKTIAGRGFKPPKGALVKNHDIECFIGRLIRSSDEAPVMERK